MDACTAAQAQRNADAISGARRRRLAVLPVIRPWVENKNGARAISSAYAWVAKVRAQEGQNDPNDQDLDSTYDDKG